MNAPVFKKGFFKVLAILLALAAPLARATETVLIGADASWWYYNQQTPPPESWKSPGFDADQWNSGPAQLGYGDGDEATVIDGGALNPHPVSAYFLRGFIIDVPPSSFSKLVFRLLRDDGAVVYVNGIEVLRSNMPDGPITPDTLAATTVGADGETTFYSYDVPSSALVSGVNTVAVEVHQANVSSTDVSFALQVIGVSGDVTPPPRPIVSITATQTQTAETDTGAEVPPGVFVIKRTGSTDSLLPVYVDYGGTAGFGTDYSDVLVEVDLAVGQASREVIISPLVDFTKEPTETVIATISEPPTNPNSAPYDIDPDHASATVYIADSPTAIEIISPANGATFAVGDTIGVTAVAFATEGTFQKILFYDGDTLIGTSAPVTVPVAAGGSVTYHIDWQNASTGDHVLTARGAVTTSIPNVPGGTYYSQKVTVHVASTTEPPVLSIEATRPTTSEPLPTAIVASGLFTIHRSGRTDTSFTAFVIFGGTATAGADYKELASSISFAAGQIDARIEVVPAADDLVEGPETVVAELSQPPTAGPVAWYNIDPNHNRAVVTINDEDSSPARITITSPENGAGLPYNGTVTVKATAVDPDGYIPRVEFFSDDVSIGVSEIAFFTAPANGTPIYHQIDWHNLPFGEHVLTARGVRANGEQIVSPPVKVFVAVIDPPPPPIVSIRTVADPTLRPIPNADYASDFFEIRRTFPTNNPLTVYFEVPLNGDHMATPDVDYKALKSPITIPAGEFATYMRVDAIDDTLVEGPEIVRVMLVPPPINADGTVSSGYSIDSEHRSSDVTILDNDQSADQVTLTVDVIDGIASEITTTDAFDTALFAIRRVSGPIDVPVNVTYTMTGTAQNGVDYKQLSGSVQIPAGAERAVIEIEAIPDNLAEGEETVILSINLPPCAFPGVPPDCYLVNDHGSGRAVILDQRDDPPTVRLNKPADGGVFTVGQTIDIEAQASDREGVISNLEILADAELLGTADGPKDYLLVHWTTAKVGEHNIVAHVVDAALQDALAEIHIRVRPMIEITEPKPEAKLIAGSTITVKATAVDPDGYIPRVEFFSDDVSIGVSQIDFLVAPDPGTPVYHSIEWKNIPLGDHVLTAKATRSNGETVVSPGVTVHVGNTEPPPQVVLAVEVIDGIASEVTTTDALDTAAFAIKRVSGPSDVAIHAQYQMSGTAQNGVDYQQLNGIVDLQAGQMSAVVKVVPIPDNIVEGEETVILTLFPANCPLAVGVVPPPECYLVGDANTGRAVIVDKRDDAPGVKILSPLNGAVFTLGNIVQIEAQAYDRERIISNLEILADGQLLGHTNMDHIYVIWSHAAVGQHSIVARATDGSGQVAKSEIHILVQDQNASAFVFRKLPPAYTPGTAFTVELRAEPPAGARAYAVEDRPPTAWGVAEVSEGGAFDPATGKVKFGPFTDTTARTLTYRVTPPATASGRQEFSGIGSVDGVNYAIGGDRLIEPSPNEHPADTDKNYAIVVSEVTAYAASWKSGGDIPISYVTRAGYLWKHGEGYKFDGSQAPPLCWVPLDAVATPIVPFSSVIDAERSGNGETQSGVSANFQIHVTPPAGTSACAVEEKVPLGWTVSNISDDGTFDSVSGTIRWGVFYDDIARTLSYTLTPPPAVTVVAHLSGRVSFDGAVYEIGGSGEMTSTDPAAQPTLAKCDTDGSGKVHLELSGAAGQVGVLQTSTDLVHWQDVTTLYLPDGTVQFDDDASGSAVRYYRLQIR